ncbi:DUF4232 domain-containing protein [Streptomyces sp. NPDC029080]|uniref:DUF4232 domain-containing protein n=1 Tax=Streptomyces sp. NPDC029080 TaxID=3155017 RepID=UPI0033EB18F5
MPATTRRAGGLTALTASLTLTAAGLALAGCTTTTATPDGSAPPATAPTASTPQTTARPCRTASLTWTLSLVDGGRGGGAAGDGAGTAHGGSRSDARLVAVNKGPAACVFTGYPGLEIHEGKAESIEGAGPGHPAAVPLPAGAAVAVGLRYTPRGAKGADTWCVRQGEAVVRAPRDSGAVVVPVRDARGKAAVLDVCGNTIVMAPPGRLAQSALHTEAPL